MEISPDRLRGWLDGFYSRHDGATENGLVLTGLSNGDTATLSAPPGHGDPPDVDALLTALGRPPRIALLLARKGAVAVAVVEGTTIVASKVQRFYVQGRTAAGGTSQRRYARRRANQADDAVGRSADIAARVLLPYAPRRADAADHAGAVGTEPDAGGPVTALACGGDRSMIEAVLSDGRLAPLLPLRHPHLLDCPEPRLTVLQDAAAAARRVRILLMP